MMEWITANLESVLAIVGAAFVLLRLIVALTPTPKDDQLINNAFTTYQKILGVASKCMGLDTTQGISSDKDKDKGVPKLPITIVMIVSFFLFPSCRALDPVIEAENGKLLLIQKSFTSTVNILTSLNDAGHFDKDDQLRLTSIIHQVDTYLKEWETSNRIGVDRPDIIKYLIPLLTELENSAGVKPLVNLNTINQ